MKQRIVAHKINNQSMLRGHLADTSVLHFGQVRIQFKGFLASSYLFICLFIYKILLMQSNNELNIIYSLQNCMRESFAFWSFYLRFLALI